MTVTAPPTAEPATMGHDLRASIGFFTRLPVGDTSGRDLRPGRAILLAPVPGLILGVVAALVMVLVGIATDAAGGHLLAAAAAVGALALLTRGLHLDGLADLADGLGASRAADRSLAVMHRSDIGPFGVIAVVVALLLQATALAVLSETGWAVLGLLVALPAARLAISWLCRPGVPAAPGSRLGTWVAGSVRTRAAAAASIGWIAAAAAAGAAISGVAAAAAASAAVVIALAAVMIVGRGAQTRLGGVTGDVLGAAIEVAQTASLVAMALLLG